MRGYRDIFGWSGPNMHLNMLHGVENLFCMRISCAGKFNPLGHYPGFPLGWQAHDGETLRTLHAVQTLLMSTVVRPKKLITMSTLFSLALTKMMEVSSWAHHVLHILPKYNDELVQI